MATFYIEQFGCRATQADGAALERQLLERGCHSGFQGFVKAFEFLVGLRMVR
jgi:hypothetical protein